MPEPQKCPLFLSGRCQRKKCDFSHAMPPNTSSSAAENDSKDQPLAHPSNSMKSVSPCRFYQVCQKRIM